MFNKKKVLCICYCLFVVQLRGFFRCVEPLISSKNIQSGFHLSKKQKKSPTPFFPPHYFHMDKMPFHGETWTLSDSQSSHMGIAPQQACVLQKISHRLSNVNQLL